VLDQLLAGLPKWCSSYHFVCNPYQSNADLVKSAFLNAGFEHSAQTTLLRYPTDGAVMAARKGKHNGHIKRAAKRLDCLEINAAEFVHFFEENLRARNKTSYAPPGIIRHLAEEALRRGQARVLAARSKDQDQGRLLGPLYDAAIVYIWDRSHCYYWMSTYRTADNLNTEPRPHPDAVKLLAMHAMQHAQDMGLIFDADGVTTPERESHQ
jgi:hypothetical protein